PVSVMPPTTIHSILQMAELAECLSHYLTTRDVACAMATCKLWATQLQPFLWIDFCPGPTMPGKRTLNQNLHHIRAIEVILNAKHASRSIESQSFGDLLRALAQGLPTSPTTHSDAVAVDHAFWQSAQPKIDLCTNLRRIKLVLGPSDTTLDKSSWPPLRTLLRYNINLTHLSMDMEGNYDFQLAPLVQLLPALSRLHHLTLRAPPQKGSWFLSLLRACLPLPRLQELYCYFTIDCGARYSEGNPPDEPLMTLEAALATILQEAIVARNSRTGHIDTKIKAIRFPDLKEGDGVSIVLPILSSELVAIETLEIPNLYNDRGEDFYLRIVREHCPGLKHLIIPHYGYFSYSSMALFTIKGAAGLKTVRSDGFSDAYGWSSREIVRTLATYHSSTLEELELLNCKMLSSADQQAVLASCRQLKRFWVVPHGISQGERGLKFQHILEGEWGCLGLKALSVSMNRAIDVKSTVMAIQQESPPSNGRKASEEGEQEGSASHELGQAVDQEQERRACAWAAKRVYAQIGRLVALETLALETDQVWYGKEEDVLVTEWDLTLSRGWLAEVAGLKNLRHLQMRTDYWSRMGQAEVEFMDAEWPLLGDISFDMEKQRLLELVEQPHWKWLRQKRPDLRLSALQLNLPERGTLEQNLHHIRTLDFARPFEVNLPEFLRTLFHGLPMPSATRTSETVADRECKQAEEGTVVLCRNLRRLNAVVYLPMDPHDNCWTLFEPLIRHNNNLTHLHVEFNVDTPPPVKQAFTALHCLHHLTVKGYVFEESWFLSLLQACLLLPRLSEVYCQFAIEAGDYTFEGDSDDEAEVDEVANPQGELKTILEKAIMARTSTNSGFIDFKIKTLRFPGAREGDIINIMLPVWTSELVEIETLEVPELVYYRPDAFYEEMARKCCSGVRHLIIPPYYAEDHPTAVCCFVRGATGLRTVRGSGFTDAYGSTSSKMIPTLVAHHFRTLEELELVDCKMIRSPDQQAILASCKNLKRFWVVPEDVHWSQLGLRFLDIVDREWVCLGLRELSITLRRASGVQLTTVTLRHELSVSTLQKLSEECEYEDQEPDERPDPEQMRRVASWLAKRVYTQIGQLMVLETLALAAENALAAEWDLTLCKGWLAELSGLKNLRSLQLRTDYWSRMGQAEVEFMDAKWPFIGGISFNLGKSELQDLLKLPHWQWLQQKRPHMRLTRLSL
ncbi:hypothetical protein BGZ70_000634, partial [Mortierella alpina]